MFLFFNSQSHCWSNITDEKKAHLMKRSMMDCRDSLFLSSASPEFTGMMSLTLSIKGMQIETGLTSSESLEEQVEW